MSVFYFAKISVGAVSEAFAETDFLAFGSSDFIFVASSGGQVTVAENQATVPLLNANGTPFALPASATFAGTSQNFLGNGLNNLFVRTATGQLVDEGFNNGGVDTWTQVLTVASGAPVTIDPNATVAGSALNFLGNGLDNLLVISAGGQLVDEGFTAAGVEAVAQPLMFGPGDPFTGQTSPMIAGTALNFFGNGLSNLFVLLANGQVVDEGFTTAGVDTWTQPLWDRAGAPFTIDPSARIVGAAQDFLGNNLANLFVIEPSRQLVDEGFTNAGLDTWTEKLWVEPNAPFLFDPSATVAGAAPNFFGNDLGNLFVREAGGQIVDQGFSAAGIDTWTQPLTLDGSTPFTLDPGQTIVGTASNFMGDGLSDVFVRDDDGQIVDDGFSAAGIDDWTERLGDSDGAVFTLAANETIVGAGQNLFGGGDNYRGYDLFQRSPSGQLSDTEFSQYGISTGIATFPALGDGDSEQVLSASPGHETVTGPVGASTLFGDGNPDTFVFGPGVTQEAIINHAIGAPTPAPSLDDGDDGSGEVTEIYTITTYVGFPQGVLDVTAVNSPSNVWLDRVDDNGNISATGNNLRIDVLGTPDAATIEGWFAGSSAAPLSQIAVPGAVGGALYLDNNFNSSGEFVLPTSYYGNVGTLVQAMATYEAGYATAHGAAFDPTSPANATITDPTVLAAVNAAWQPAS